MPRCFAAFLAALAVSALSASSVSSAPPPEGDFDRGDIANIENLVEDFANSLHELSYAIVQRDLDAMAKHVADDFRGSDIPVGEGPTSSLSAWIERRPARSPRTGLDGEAFLDAWGLHLAGFQSIEDARIKIKKAKTHADEDPIRIDAKIKFFWIGRDLEGRREWLKGVGHAIGTRRGESDWVLHEFVIEELTSTFTTTDMFSEVSLAAGTGHTVPAWGKPGNEMFLAHGVAVTDVDNDGRLDVFVTGNQENFLYRNLGDGTFENIAMETLVAITPPATGALFVDYDNDGDSDLFLASTDTQMLFENRLVPDGELIFDDVSEVAGVALPAEGYSVLSADVNGDAFPDIYLCSYAEYGAVMPNSWSNATNGTPNYLFLNRGDGTFAEVGEEWGVRDARWTYAAQFGDLTGDGRPDLYVANDFGRNAFYVNEGDRFREATEESGLQDTGNGMGVYLGDYDNDGALDVHVTNMSSTAGNRILKMVFPDADGTPEYARTLAKIAAGNTLFRNVGDRWENVAPDVGPFSGGWAFGGGFIDLDNDGWEDLYSPNGFISGKGLKDT